VCPNDDDWYKVKLFDGNTLTIDMTSTGSGDLDLHLFKGEFTDLWPCSAANPDMCSSTRGQGPGANEHAVHTQATGCAAGCDFYVVVRGYDGAENPDYGLTIKVQ
jgi:hypothetical protein